MKDLHFAFIGACNSAKNKDSVAEWLVTSKKQSCDLAVGFRQTCHSSWDKQFLHYMVKALTKGETYKEAFKKAAQSSYLVRVGDHYVVKKEFFWDQAKNESRNAKLCPAEKIFLQEKLYPVRYGNATDKK